MKKWMVMAALLWGFAAIAPAWGTPGLPGKPKRELFKKKKKKSAPQQKKCNCGSKPVQHR
jgi:hypothetical protein